MEGIKKAIHNPALDYFGARYYSNGLGRFITPDWAAKAAAVPYAEFSAVASIFDVYVRIPESDRKSDAIQVCLDHIDGLSTEVFSRIKLWMEKWFTVNPLLSKEIELSFALDNLSDHLTHPIRW